MSEKEKWDRKSLVLSALIFHKWLSLNSYGMEWDGMVWHEKVTEQPTNQCIAFERKCMSM